MNPELLILDDTEEIQGIVPREILNRYSSLHSFRTINEFHRFVKDRNFDLDNCIGLIDVDLEDPLGRTGITAVSALLDVEVVFPTIFISNDVSQKYQVDAAGAGSYAYLAKLDLMESISALEEALVRAEGALKHKSLPHFKQIDAWVRKTVVLVSALDHEMDNIIQPIKTRCASLMQMELPDVVLDTVRALQSNIDDLNELINMTYNYVRTGNLSIAIKESGIRESIEYIIQNLNCINTCAVSYARGAEDTIIAVDRIRAIQILSNLVSNALKYRNEGSIVRVSVDKRDMKIIVSVFNEGEPIDDELFARKLFVPMLRGNLIENKPGQGMGLAVVKALTEMYGGTAFHKPVHLDVDRANGNIFGIELPIFEPK